MPLRLKQPPATRHSAVSTSSSPSNGDSGWKWKVVGFIIFLVLASGLWSTGFLQDLFAGPKVPLPREVLGFSLGMSLDDVLQKYPLMNLGDLFRENPNMSLEEILKKNHKLTKKKVAEMEKTLRPFNNDPNFGIATIMPQAGLTGAESVDVLFYLPTKQLYFVSTMWDGNDAKTVPVDDWAKTFRRWIKNPSQTTENLSPDVNLKEWHYVDKQTEMTVRNLAYSDHVQRWQDLRDASNEAAQAAFSKYRLETGN